MTKPTLAIAGNAIQALCLIAVAAAVVKHEFFSSPPARRLSTVSLSAAQWREVASSGRWIGNPRAPVTVVLFADFQCPACRQFETRTLRPALAARSGQFAVLFRHLPLSYHENAMPAARASECAAAQGRFAEFADSLYEYQELLGKRSYEDFARSAHVPDIIGFDRCADMRDSVPTIQADIKEADAINAQGTPTIIVNGVLYNTVPDSAEFERLISQAVKKAAR